LAGASSSCSSAAAAAAEAAAASSLVALVGHRARRNLSKMEERVEGGGGGGGGVPFFALDDQERDPAAAAAAAAGSSEPRLRRSDEEEQEVEVKGGAKSLDRRPSREMIILLSLPSPIPPPPLLRQRTRHAEPGEDVASFLPLLPLLLPLRASLEAAAASEREGNIFVIIIELAFVAVVVGVDFVVSVCECAPAAPRIGARRAGFSLAGGGRGRRGCPPERGVVAGHETLQGERERKKEGRDRTRGWSSLFFLPFFEI